MPLTLVLGPLGAITSLGGLLLPVSFLFNRLITIVLFGWSAWLINDFWLKQGLQSAVLGGRCLQRIKHDPEVNTWTR